ncbi:unnamed protein product [Prunus armeniaca]|uniref:Uncharacterized protein n=1 Tax=Prunus armeniaca TaxID=36596 RepID=A0A6J5XZN3_PRUAR|nr:unnamed protein product [Prunus armeniaca]
MCRVSRVILAGMGRKTPPKSLRQVVSKLGLYLRTAEGQQMLLAGSGMKGGHRWQSLK